MKNKNSFRIFTFVIMGLFLILTNSCGKDDNNSGNGGIIIKGKISGMMKNGNSLTDAKKLFVVNVHIGSLNSSFVDITDGSFSYNSQMGIATALVFLDENNKYIGTLSTQGLNLLPLCNLSNGENTTIDLATLTLVGTSVIPSHDPLGNEIIITDAEIKSLKEIDGFFEALSKNIDADNDGILDVLSNKQLFIKSKYSISGGQWGSDNSAPVLPDSVNYGLGSMLELDGDKGFSLPNSIVLSGPADSPYNDITTQFINPGGEGGFYSGIWRNVGNTLLPFKKGTYNLTIDGNDYTMDYSNIDAKKNLIFVIPTLHTNSEGKLVSVSLEYKLPNHKTINPVNILTDVMIQLNDDSNNQFYTSPRLINMNAEMQGCDCVKGLFTYTFASPLDISTLKRITIAYSDLLGNPYLINWNK